MHLVAQFCYWHLEHPYHNLTCMSCLSSSYFIKTFENIDFLVILCTQTFHTTLWTSKTSHLFVLISRKQITNRKMRSRRFTTRMPAIFQSPTAASHIYHISCHKPRFVVSVGNTNMTICMHECVHFNTDVFHVPTIRRTRDCSSTRMKITVSVRRRTHPIGRPEAVSRRATSRDLQ